MIENILVVILIVIAGMAGYSSKLLTITGSAAAIMIGVAVYLGFRWDGLLLLGTFFASSSLWSNYKSSLKTKLDEKLAKGTTRDWRQVFANGGTAALTSILYYFDHSFIWLIAFCVAIASANSDTWASEIGSLSRKNPIFIRTFKRTEKGTSGAVSLLGSIAALSGSLLIALLCWWLFHFGVLYLCIIFILGFIGNFIDTLIGAFYQQLYFCKNCGLETEKKIHCQEPTVKLKGFKYMDNDMVNFLSGFLAVILVIGIVHIIN